MDGTIPKGGFWGWITERTKTGVIAIDQDRNGGPSNA